MLKLNVGLSRKVGEANYGSRGASVNLELELDTALIGEPDRLRDRIRQMFQLARASVDEELTGHADSHGNGHTNGQRRTSGGRRATVSQVRAIHTIADRQGIQLEELLRSRFGTSLAEQLSITEASQLIDELKGAATNGHGTNGHGGRR